MFVFERTSMKVNLLSTVVAVDLRRAPQHGHMLVPEEDVVAGIL